MPYDEAKRADIKGHQVHFDQEDMKEASAFREEYKKRKGVIKAEEMPWEESAHGHIKHVVNDKMDTAEMALNVYIQTIPPGGASGKRRHLAEEVFYVLDGRGYDLHWDVDFDCKETFIWNWLEEPKKFEWEEGDLVYIPPYTTYQHFNADPERPVRIIAAYSRALKYFGFNWMEQVEPAPDYKGG